MIFEQIRSTREFFQQPPLDAVWHGLMLSLMTILLTFFLEILSTPTVHGVLKQRDGLSLYKQAVGLNFVNHFLYGVPCYTFAVSLFCSTNSTASFPHGLMRTCIILVIHALLYYFAHKAFHSSPHLYAFHRFHHRFNTHVPPVAANAVSAGEYLIAYIAPFVVGAWLVRPQEVELRVAVALISISNLLIHTPRLEKISMALGPVLVTTHGHIEHHRRLNVHYAAPMLNVDWLLVQFQKLLTSSKVA